MTVRDPGAAPAPEYLTGSEVLLDGLRLGGVGVWRWRIDSDELHWTENLEQVHHLPRGAFDGTLSSFQRDLHPEDAEAVWQSIRASLATGRRYQALYRTAPHPGSESRWIEAWGGVVAGDGRYLTGVCMDVTARVRGERELERRLVQQKAIGRVGSFALHDGDLGRVMEEAAATAAAVLDLPLVKILRFAGAADRLDLVAGVGWNAGIVGRASVGIDGESQAGFTLMTGGPVVVADLWAETRFSGPPLLFEHGVRSGMSVVIPGGEARPFGVFGVHSRELRRFDQADVDFLLALANIVANAARQDAAQAQRQLLVREMLHRAGNMLQLVGTIANQTFPDGLDDAGVAEARGSFGDRLASLSRANYLIAKGGWTATRFVALAREALQPFEGRVAFEGRDIMLPPDLCFDLGLILHELATNSAKYGTLGAARGEVAVRWTLAVSEEGGHTFRCAWEDPDAPPRPEVGDRGFGSKLLAALIDRKWGGSHRVETDPGYRFAFELPVAS